MITQYDVECIYVTEERKRKKGSTELVTEKKEQFRFIGKLFEISREMQFRLFQMEVDDSLCLEVINNTSDIVPNSLICIKGIYYRVKSVSGTMLKRNILLIGEKQDVAS